MDAFFGHVTVSLVIPAILAPILVRLCRHQLRELDPRLAKICVRTLGQNVLAR
ncbi:hypothetical protein A2U01_0090430, partial [Trifolium medium]|nr:hypothetical protein [Trifolium medium]